MVRSERTLCDHQRALVQRSRIQITRQILVADRKIVEWSGDLDVVRPEPAFCDRNRFEEYGFCVGIAPTLLEQVTKIDECVRQTSRDAARARRNTTQFRDCLTMAAFGQRCSEALARSQTAYDRRDGL